MLLWYNLWYYPDTALEELRKASQDLNQDIRSPGPRSETGNYRIRRSANHWSMAFAVIVSCENGNEHEGKEPVE